MGFFSSLLGTVKDFDDEAAGHRLHEQVNATVAEFQQLDERGQFIVMSGYLEIRQRLFDRCSTLSNKSRIELGEILQKQAREAFRTDATGAYAKWLAGAWIESRERNTLKGQQALALLEGFADFSRQALDELK